MFFDLRRFFFPARELCFMLVLLSAILLLVTCKQCPVNEAQNRLEVDACRNNRGNLDNASSDLFGGKYVDLGLTPRGSVEKNSLENICPVANSCSFVSTLTALFVSDIGSGLEVSDGSMDESEGLLSGSRKMTGNMSWSLHQGSISCSFSLQDSFTEFSSSGGKSESDKKNHDRSCISPLVDKISQHSKSVREEKDEIRLLDGLSAPLVEIKPSMLDWGIKNMFQPSLAFLTVKNVHEDTVLSAYGPFSSDSQFYPCNSREVTLAPGEVGTICFVFLPMHLGLSVAQIVLQTSFGGFVIQAKGFAIESPYFVEPLSGLDISVSGRWRKNLSLFNPSNGALYVEEVTAWITTSSGKTSHSKSICRFLTVDDYPDGHSMLSAEDWLAVERGEVGQPNVAMRPHKNWVVGPQETETIMELDISDQFEGTIVAAFCLQLLRSPDNEVDTVMVPLGADLKLNAVSSTAQVTLSLEALAPYGTSGLIAVTVSIRNDAPYSLSFIKVAGVAENVKNIQIKYIEGLALFPKTVTQIAILTYACVESNLMNSNCKLLVLVNDTRASQMEILCTDLINICSGIQLNSPVGHTRGLGSIDYINGIQRIFSWSMQQPLPNVKDIDSPEEADRSVLRNWKSHGTARSLSVLYDKELLFPTVLVGNYCSQWLAVRNPSDHPIVMQLILNPLEVIDKCQMPEIHLQPSLSSILLGKKSITPASYGFSLAKDASTEVLIHPHGNATFGPIMFQPSNRCEWRSSVLIRNNLSGVEWLPLRGFGGSVSLVLHEGNDLVRSLEFRFNLQVWLNFSSPETSQAPCYQPLTKDVHVKNTGDLPLEVTRIEVSGAKCGLDGFTVHHCKGFSLQPGESVKLRISYQSDFSAATIHRNLELVLASDLVVIPMKATLPLCVLKLCKVSLIWIWLKKLFFPILFVACLVAFLLFPQVAAVVAQHIRSGKNSLLNSVLRLLNEAAMVLKINGSTQEESLLRDKGHVDLSVGHQKQTRSLLHTEPGGTIAVASRSSSAENLDVLDSRNLRVRTGHEKGRRRRRKKSSGPAVFQFEVSSSQSGTSTPSSPLSPFAFSTPKQSRAPSPGMQQSDESKCLTKDKDAPQHDKAIKNLTRRATGKAVLLPSSTFPGAGAGTGRTMSSHARLLASTLDPHVRAPGTKLNHSPRSDNLEQQKYIYDIWGEDHLFGKEISGSSATESNSESFFVRGPQTLMTTSILQSLTPESEGNE